MLGRLILAATLAIAAAGSSSAVIPSHQATELGAPGNETVIQKNQAWPVARPIMVETCGGQTCQSLDT